MSTITKPSRVDRAFERLDSALSRLEKVVQTRSAMGGGTGNDGGDSDALRQENAHLQAVNEEVKGRLDGAIGRLEKVLGS
ncbi:MAG: hypothetical protein RIB80_01495 [Rhodospirillales bacterium]